MWNFFFFLKTFLELISTIIQGNKGKKNKINNSKIPKSLKLILKNISLQHSIHMFEYKNVFQIILLHFQHHPKE